jgi:hypothetical protein
MNTCDLMIQQLLLFIAKNAQPSIEPIIAY